MSAGIKFQKATKNTMLNGVIMLYPGIPPEANPNTILTLTLTVTRGANPPGK